MNRIASKAVPFEAGQSHMELRGFLPPPLSPPHKGEGDAGITFRAKIIEVFAI